MNNALIASSLIGKLQTTSTTSTRTKIIVIMLFKSINLASLFFIFIPPKVYPKSFRQQCRQQSSLLLFDICKPLHRQPSRNVYRARNKYPHNQGLSASCILWVFRQAKTLNHLLTTSRAFFLFNTLFNYFGCLYFLFRQSYHRQQNDFRHFQCLVQLLVL